MNLDAHFSERDLARFATVPESVPPGRRLDIERHVETCSKCSGILGFFAAAEEDLADPDVWDPVVGSERVNNISAVARRVVLEDEEADRLLAGILEHPGQAVWGDVWRKPQFRTGGVVRRLNARAHEVFADRPLDALTFAEAGIALAELLPDDAYPFNAVYDLRGTAWKERANALVRLGRLNEALDSLTRAERAYRHLSAAGFGLSSVALVRAATLYQQQRLEEATVSAELAERGFAHLGQERARMKAVQLLGQIHYENLQLDKAAAVFERLMDYGREVNDAGWIARGAYMLASCELDRGNVAEASVLFTQALAIFREIGPASDLLSTEWGLARVVLQGGRYHDAVRRLDDVMQRFHGLGMTTDAALVALDMAEALFASGQTKRIAQLASQAFHECRKAGMHRGAMTALAYFKDAAKAGRVDATVIDAIRVYLRRVEREPELGFLPPSQL